MKSAYKIFDLHKDKTGKHIPKTLFHGVRGCRSLPVNEWVYAELKLVTDGSSQNQYLSGFHAYPNLDAVRKWLKGAKNLKNRVVVKVILEGCFEKPNAVRPTILARKMKITKQAWKKRKSALIL
jgi:hypothetical protein